MNNQNNSNNNSTNGNGTNNPQPSPCFTCPHAGKCNGGSIVCPK